MHIPGTHLTNEYRAEGPGETAEEAFCRRLHESSVDAFGITDYFDATNVIRIINMYRDRYRDSPKLLIPNVELRLTDIVNKDDQFVNFHLLFNPDIPGDKVADFVRRLPVELTEESGRRKECGELEARDFAKATVSRSGLMKHIRHFFGDRTPRDANVLTLVPAGNDGIRAQQGSQRKAQLAREIETDTDALFGSQSDREWYLQTDRYGAGSDPSHPRPTYKASDAHSFAQLDERYHPNNVLSFTTWIKSDLTYEGLRQTLLEPSERVRIGGSKPDEKSPFKWLRRVGFSGTNFPEEVQLSENLTAIVGSRSSGKSALLAHIAFAVSPVETAAQMQGGNLAGPAAGVTWAQAASEECQIEWAAPQTRGGKVIYVPQNALYALSERPNEITERIRPLIDKRFDKHSATLIDYETGLSAADGVTRREVETWFEANAAAGKALTLASTIGDTAGIEARRAELADRIQRRVTDIDDRRVTSYTSAISRLDYSRQKATQQIELEGLRGDIEVSIDVRPSLDDIGDEVASEITAAVQESTQLLQTRINELRREFVARQRSLIERAEQDEIALRSQYSDVVTALSINADATEALRERRKLDSKLAEIRQHEAQAKALQDRAVKASGAITAALSFVEENLRRAEQEFSTNTPIVDGMRITLESGYPSEAELVRAQGINKMRDSRFVTRGRGVNLEDAQTHVHEFLQSLALGETSLNAGADLHTTTVAILTARSAIRLVAELDGDRIGGFSDSSMTPGKQALFALTLLLGEDGDGWPLLLDQPEDDLDSRSIYDNLVPYLLRRKRERQIILVSHNANLVVGADSECVVVANRHGSDRPNHRGRTFDYRTGSLENSFSKPSAATTLDRQGIREHVCQLLDGGPEAFQRRSRKYRLNSV